ncbi:hypothetical protein A3709_03275 [Halioglobus sp. HI00S01]|uniref:ABC transporter ATP-binding protein n=1 Tax=Halioglobus sp. HI00S01 TaxID=1822214 RepID=UPI0007C3EFDB|nr:ABC transporter ATP-binding protein [Halioglobus sp. HI00S01]KZX56816.1 hypothetical protein A3709_03275 [Halioglobus sp. HI00S01]
MATEQLQIDAVDVHYGQFQAVKGASLTLARGELGCLLGASGCGKTSLLRAIAGFEPVSAGSVVLHQRQISSAQATTPPEHRQVGMVFQDFALFPHLSVRRNVGFGLTGLDRKAQAARVQELLELVEMGDFARAYPHELSGGQQQRVALARALAPAPELLLLDEPFSSLDTELREQLAGQVRRLLKQTGTTALMVTHDRREAFAMADRIAVMEQGHIVQYDTPLNLFRAPATPFVANAITRGALLPLEIVNRTDGRDHILYELALTADQRIPCRTGPDIDLAVGELLSVYIDLDNAVALSP